MRNTTRPFLMAGDPACEVLLKWQAVGVCCQLDETGVGVAVVNTVWPKPGTFDSPPPPVPTDALDELGQWYDEILCHLLYWRQTREVVEKIWAEADHPCRNA